jgi:hypothetical protein
MQHSRYEVNREIRNVLLRHDVDLLFVNYSLISHAVYISGHLTQSFHVEFSIDLIKELVRDLRNIPDVLDVQFDLDNWHITSSASSLKINKLKVKASAADIAFLDLDAADDNDETEDEEIAEAHRKDGKRQSKKRGRKPKTFLGNQ